MKGAKNKKHIITTQTEHKCVLDSCRFLEQEGFDITYLPVMNATGMVDMEELENSMRDDTLLVSVMAVNNEIGTRQPVEEIGALCRSKKILFHTDGKLRLLIVLIVLFDGVNHGCVYINLILTLYIYIHKSQLHKCLVNSQLMLMK